MAERDVIYRLKVVADPSANAALDRMSASYKKHFDKIEQAAQTSQARSTTSDADYWRKREAEGERHAAAIERQLQRRADSTKKKAEEETKAYEDAYKKQEASITKMIGAARTGISASTQFIRSLVTATASSDEQAAKALAGVDAFEKKLKVLEDGLGLIEALREGWSSYKEVLESVNSVQEAFNSVQEATKAASTAADALKAGTAAAPGVAGAATAAGVGGTAVGGTGAAAAGTGLITGPVVATVAAILAWGLVLWEAVEITQGYHKSASSLTYRIAEVEVSLAQWLSDLTGIDFVALLTRFSFGGPAQMVDAKEVARKEKDAASQANKRTQREEADRSVLAEIAPLLEQRRQIAGALNSLAVNPAEQATQQTAYARANLATADARLKELRRQENTGHLTGYAPTDAAVEQALQEQERAALALVEARKRELDLVRQTAQEQIAGAKATLQATEDRLKAQREILRQEENGLKTLEERLATLSASEIEQLKAADQAAREYSRTGKPISMDQARALRGLPGYEDAIDAAQKAQLKANQLEPFLEIKKQQLADAKKVEEELVKQVQVDRNLVIDLQVNTKKQAEDIAQEIGDMLVQHDNELILRIEALLKAKGEINAASVNTSLLRAGGP